MYQIIDNVKSLELETAIDNLQEDALKEGNTSITNDKYDVRTTPGIPFLILWENKVAGMCSLEPSIYTGDPEVAVRACRHHVLKKYRNIGLGILLFDAMVKRARKDGYKIFYITQDIHNKSLNAVYQRRKKVPQINQSMYDNEMANLKLDKRLLFQVDPRSDLLQYVYYVDLQSENYNWQPKQNMIWRNHDGKL